MYFTQLIESYQLFSDAISNSEFIVSHAIVIGIPWWQLKSKLIFIEIHAHLDALSLALMINSICAVIRSGVHMLLQRIKHINFTFVHILRQFWCEEIWKKKKPWITWPLWMEHKRSANHFVRASQFVHGCVMGLTPNGKRRIDKCIMSVSRTAERMCAAFITSDARINYVMLQKYRAHTHKHKQTHSHSHAATDKNPSDLISSILLI